MLERDKDHFSTLSNIKISENLKTGRIVIQPFAEGNLNTSSYDVSLGEWYFREQRPPLGVSLYSPWSEIDVRAVWGEPQHAVVAHEYSEEHGVNLPKGIRPLDRIILIPPQETLLCHTQEFIGGRDGITTMMKARSSMGRNFIEVCKCAGWGDVGYINRWTMEITNNSRHYTIPLVVGRRIAQIVFFEVGSTNGRNYGDEGKYQAGSDVAKLENNWSPDDMLPKMWNDREARS